MNKWILSLCCCATLLPAVAIARNADDQLAALKKCQEESHKDARLACYDKALPPAASSAAEPAPGSIGKWRLASKTSPVDDSKNVYISLNANETIRSPFGESITPSLYILCREKKTEMFLNWDVYLGLNETQMLYRLDKQKAVTHEWGISTDTKAVFYRGKDIDFIKMLAKSSNLFVRITPYNENPVQTTFDLTGLAEALKPVQAACGWKSPATA